jgi:hypothetical protein
VAACVVALACAGCATGPMAETSTADRKGSGQSSDGVCAWKFDKTDNGKLDKKSLELTKGQTSCSIESTDPPLYISADKTKWYQIRASGPVYVETDGSCRYCYINAGGGLTCIVYPGC